MEECLQRVHLPSRLQKPLPNSNKMRLQYPPSRSTSTRAPTKMKKTTSHRLPSQPSTRRSEPPSHLLYPPCLHHPAHQPSWPRHQNPQPPSCHPHESQPQTSAPFPILPRSQCAYPPLALFLTAGRYRIAVHPLQTATWDFLPAQVLRSRHQTPEARYCCRQATPRSTGPTCKSRARTCRALTR
jgi:hypothetical protein